MKIHTTSKLEDSQHKAIKAAWESGPNAAAHKEEFGEKGFDSFKAYFENDDHFKATGEIKPKW